MGVSRECLAPYSQYTINIRLFSGQETDLLVLLQFRQKYRAVYASPEWPSVGQNLSWIHVLDDHEIHNDWDGYVFSFPILCHAINVLQGVLRTSKLRSRLGTRCFLDIAGRCHEITY